MRNVLPKGTIVKLIRRDQDGTVHELGLASWCGLNSSKSKAMVRPLNSMGKPGKKKSVSPDNIQLTDETIKKVLG